MKIQDDIQHVTYTTYNAINIEELKWNLRYVMASPQDHQKYVLHKLLWHPVLHILSLEILEGQTVQAHLNQLLFHRVTVPNHNKHNQTGLK